MSLVCGIDEAGRGPLAGPVVAAAVVLGGETPSTSTELRGLVADSKKLSQKRREIACKEIQCKALAWATGWAWPEEIDTLNIHHATLLAMERAFQCLHVPLASITQVQVDGKFCPPLRSWKGQREAIVKGDSLIPEISAASIMAKVYRDRLMAWYDTIYPAWEFAKHKGYPTKRHRELCQAFGVSPIHRKSFHLG